MKEQVIWYIDPEIFDNSFNINRMGVAHGADGSLFDRKDGMDEFLFIMFHTPTYIKIDGCVKLCEPNTLVIWSPGASQYYGGSEIQWCHSWLVCSGEMVESWLLSGDIPMESPIKLSEPIIFEWYLQAIHNELVTRSEPDKKIIRNFAENLVVEISRGAGGDGAIPVIPKEYLNLRTFIDGNFTSHLNIAQLAAQVNQSIPHFCRQFKRWFSLAPIEYVCQLRLQHASNLLGNPHLLVGEIAQMSGYKDVYYFSRAFKKHFGVSPTQMRKYPTRVKLQSSLKHNRVEGSHL